MVFALRLFKIDDSRGHRRLFKSVLFITSRKVGIIFGSFFTSCSVLLPARVYSDGTNTFIMLLADLRKQCHGHTSLSFLDFERYTTDSPSMIAGFCIHHGSASTECLEKAQCPIQREYIKASIKGHKMAVQGARLLNGEGKADSMQMNITETALVCGSPTKGHAKDLEGITSFQKTQFRFKHDVSFQYLHFSGKSHPLNDMLIRDGKALYDRVCLQSGICLFSMGMVQSSLDTNGRVDASRLICPTPTLYEVEYIARACRVIADIGATILNTIAGARGQDSKVTEISLQIGLDVPSFHYFHSVQSKMQNQGCTFAGALRWMQAVMKRHEQISDVFQGYLSHQLTRRGVGLDLVKIEVSKRGFPVAAHILDSLERSMMPSFDEVLKLLGEEDGTWNDYWGILPPKERAIDFRSLSYIFYVYEVIRPALEENIIPANRRPNSKESIGRLVISIDDGAERPIYSRSQKLLKKIRSHTAVQRLPFLMEIYASRRVFINNNEAGSNLYLDDPSPDLPIVTPWKPAGEEKNHLQPPVSGFSPYDLARSLYGEETAGVLRKLFGNVGLR
ncbi:hypothetical protein GGR57DRAFT_508777 [Xylariaceae sp. FL1272]|nr:hypothetical protein GGR57DRAFT_508777 [Xylariaceae sp. FL1272]